MFGCLLTQENNQGLTIILTHIEPMTRRFPIPISPLAKERTIGALLSTNTCDQQAGKRAAIAMSRLYAYLGAAREQVRVIEVLGRKAYPKKPSYSSTMIQAFIHIHLYFICWAAIGRMIEVIKGCSGLKAPNNVWKKYRVELKQYADARDHFEHYEERLPGGKKEISSYGNLQHGWFSLGDHRWEVSKESLKKLENIVAKLDANILSDAAERVKGQMSSKFPSTNPE